jgi:hypothetical protein
LPVADEHGKFSLFTDPVMKIRSTIKALKWVTKQEEDVPPHSVIGSEH